MTLVDFVFKDAKIATSWGVFTGSVAVDDGKIVTIGSGSHMPSSDKTLDCEGKVLIAGAIDGHVHFGEPARPGAPPWMSDDFETGSKAAAAGGTTMPILMPDSWPVVTTRQILEERARIAESKSILDFGLHAALIPGMKYDEALPDLVDAGAAGFKTFTIPTAFDFWPAMREGQMLDAFRALRKANGLALVHAEDADLIAHLTSKLKAEGRTDNAVHLDSRPPISELLADQEAITIGKAAGNRLLIVHTTIPEGVKEIHAAKALGHPVFTETCPQYLYLSEEDVINKGGLAKCTPPLRDKARIAELWKMLAAGLIDTVASDHAPLATKDNARSRGDDMWQEEAGLPGVQTLMTMMMEGVLSGRISLPHLAGLTSENAARVYGFYPRKGVLLPGSDADLVVFDVHTEHKITNEEQLSGCGWTPYDGWVVHNKPYLTMARGQVVMQDGQVLSETGHGRFVKPSA